MGNWTVKGSIRQGVRLPHPEDGPDVLVHLSSIEGEGHGNLEENQKVEFEVTEGPEGPPRRRTCAPWRNDRKAVQRTRHERGGPSLWDQRPREAGPLEVDHGTGKRAVDTWDVLDPSDH